MVDTGYSSGTSTADAGSGVSPANATAPQFWSLQKCKKAYLDYLGNKVEEIEEQKEARRYYHGSHWTEKQLKTLKARRQPPSTRNQINRKVDGTIGLIERLRQEPKAYPRTPKQEQGAELATAVLRYVLDEQQWKAISPECARDAAIDGIGGIQIDLEQGDVGDVEVGIALVEPDSFFYDPRCYKPDFSDARYMGEGKWVDEEVALDMFPDKADELRGAGLNGSELSSNPDREKKWFSFDGTKRLIRLVEVWYQHKGGWCYAIFTGSLILMEGEGYLRNEKNKTACKYIMFSANVDQDGDRYGFVRNMKSTQDSLNYKHSKLNHILASKRIIATVGAVSDIEKTRAEYARSDGVVLLNSKTVDEGFKADDQSFDFAGWAKLLEEDKTELENFGPNEALIGDVQNQSGRAIQLLQQAGMAKLGPYIMGYRGWKLRVYRAIFSAVQKFWQAERWIRVTDDDGLAQFLQLNAKQKHPVTGQEVMVNALGALDVDIILDEGPDTINAQADMYETLNQVLPSIASMLSPPVAQAAVSALIDSSALPASAKKKFRDAQQQAAQTPPPPNPEIEKAQIQAQAKANENSQQLEFEKQKAGATLELNDRQHQQTLAHKSEQAHHERNLKRDQMLIDMAHEREKLGVHVDSEREKAQVQRESRQDEQTHEQAKIIANKRDPSIEILAQSIAQMAGGLTKMAESVEELGEKVAAPKKIIRNSAGDIIGAETGRATHAEQISG